MGRPRAGAPVVAATFARRDSDAEAPAPDRARRSEEVEEVEGHRARDERARDAGARMRIETTDRTLGFLTRHLRVGRGMRMRATASGRGVGRDEGEGKVSVVRGMRSGSSHLHRGVVRAHPGRYPGREHPLCRRRRHRDAPTDPAPAGRPTLPRQLGEFRTSTERARLATGGARREPPVRRTPSSCPRGPHNAARATASTPSLKPGATVARPPRGAPP